MSDDRVVHAFPKRDDEEVRASVSTFKGSLYVSLRIYYRGDDGEWHATKKGITLTVEALDELEAAIAALRKAVDETPASTPDRYERYNRARAG